MHHDFSKQQPMGAYWALANELRESCPHFYNKYSEGGYWVFTRYEAVRDIYKNPDIFSSASITPWEPNPIYRFVPTQIDAPDHIKYRRILNPWFSPRAMEVIGGRKKKVQSWYLDMNMLSSYWGEDRVYHHTAPITMNYALHECLLEIVEEGLEARWARHQLNHRALKAGLAALGIQYTAAEGRQLPSLNAVRIPQGIDDLAVRKRFDLYNQETEPLIEWYQSRRLLLTVDGLGTPDDVSLRLIRALDGRMRGRTER